MISSLLLEDCTYSQRGLQTSTDQLITGRRCWLPALAALRKAANTTLYCFRSHQQRPVTNVGETSLNPLRHTHREWPGRVYRKVNLARAERGRRKYSAVIIHAIQVSHLWDDTRNVTYLRYSMCWQGKLTVTCYSRFIYNLRWHSAQNDFRHALVNWSRRYVW